jgi:hypothetical protein
LDGGIEPQNTKPQEVLDAQSAKSFIVLQVSTLPPDCFLVSQAVALTSALRKWVELFSLSFPGTTLGKWLPQLLPSVYSFAPEDTQTSFILNPQSKESLDVIIRDVEEKQIMTNVAIYFNLRVRDPSP